MPLADSRVEEILDRRLARQGPMIGGGGGLKCHQVWTTALEQRLHTTRTRKMIFNFVRKVSIRLLPATRRRFRQANASATTATAMMTACITKRCHTRRRSGALSAPGSRA